MRRTSFVEAGLTLALASLLYLPSSNAADTIPWDQIVGIDLKKLDPPQRQRVEANLVKLQNTYGCRGTIASCMSKGDMTARRHAGFVARMVRKGKKDDEIKKGIALRKESAHPKEVFQIDLADHPLKGNPKAKVVFVEYACFECPFCAHLAPKLKNLDKAFSSKVVHYYKFFPVRSHKRGVPAALTAFAAFRQGKFWQMQDILFENRADLEDGDLVEYTKKVGLNPAKSAAVQKDPASMRYIEKDKLEGMRFGVEGTPTFFVNGKQYQGILDYEEIMDRIAEELDIVEGRI